MVTGRMISSTERGTYFFHTGDRYEGSYLLGERTGEGFIIMLMVINM